jgi:hypothetical protein
MIILKKYKYSNCPYTSRYEFTLAVTSTQVLFRTAEIIGSDVVASTKWEKIGTHTNPTERINHYKEMGYLEEKGNFYS